MSDWKLYRLGEIISLLTDYHANGSYVKLKENVTLLDEPDYAIMIRTTNFEKQDFQNDLKYIDEHAYNFLAKSSVNPHDILMNKIANAGSVYFMPDLGCPVSLAMNLFLIRVSPQYADQRFIYYMMKGHEWYIKQFATGSVTKTITKNAVRNLEFSLPPLAEQKVIANILGTLDDKIEANRRENDTLEAIARAIFKSWFVDFDPVHAKANGESPVGMDAEAADMFPDSFEESELGMIPRGWRAGVLDDAIEILSGGTPKTSIDEYWDGHIPWFSVKDLPSPSDVFVIDTERTITQKGVDNSATKILPLFTTIISARGTVGKLALTGVRMAMNQSCYGIRGANDYPNYFTYFHLKTLSEDLQRRTHGTVFDTITRKTFEAVQTVLPSLESTLDFERNVEPIMQKILNNLKENQTLAETRDALLPRLVSGELRVGEV